MLIELLYLLGAILLRIDRLLPAGTRERILVACRVGKVAIYSKLNMKQCSIDIMIVHLTRNGQLGTAGQGAEADGVD